MAESAAFRYRAFLSYSHADVAWAKWLHAKLERFRIDKDLVGCETATGLIPETLRPVFRDREDFTAGHTLNEQTLAALDASAALIVLCSLASAKSRYVNEELRLFKSRHPDRPVIPVIVDGTPDDPKDECFSPALKFKVTPEGEITNLPEEPLAADVREKGDGRNLAIAKTVARLLDLQTDEVFRRAERERRRQSRIRSTIGVAFAGLVAVGGFLAWQSHQQQQTIAEVEALVAKYSVVTPAEAAVPGARESLTTAITAIAEGAAGDARYAEALELLKAGKPAEAEPLLKAVAEEKETRAARENKQAAAAYKNLGTITRLSDPKRAREVYAKAVALDPDDVEALYFNGWLQFRAGNLDASEQAYKRVLTLMRDETGDSYEWDLWAQIDLGEIELARNNQTAALEMYRKAQSEADRLAKTYPNNAEWQFALAGSDEGLGDILMRQGNLIEALKFYRDCVTITDRLAKVDPSDARSQRSLAMTLKDVGEVLKAQGNLPEALKTFQDSVAIMDRVAKTNPNDASEQYFLVTSLDDLGDGLLAQGNMPEALKSFRNSLAIRDRLAKVDPNNAAWQRDLAVNHGRVAEILAQQGEVARALDEFQQGRAIIARLKEASPDNAQVTKDLAVFDTEIAKLEQGNAPGLGAVQPDQAAQ